jgi:hypothetical protein
MIFFIPRFFSAVLSATAFGVPIELTADSGRCLLNCILSIVHSRLPDFRLSNVVKNWDTYLTIPLNQEEF